MAAPPSPRADLAGLADALRPRLVVLRLRAGPVRLAWATPLWAFEEIAGLAVRAAPLVAWLRARAAGGPAGPAWAALDALLAPTPPGLLRLPPGEPYLRLERGPTRLEIAQL